MWFVWSHGAVALNDSVILDDHDQKKAAQVFSDQSKTKAQQIKYYYDQIYLPRRMVNEPHRQAAQNYMTLLSTEYGSQILLVQPNRIKLPRTFEGSVLGMVLLANMQEQRLFDFLKKSTLPNLFLPYLRQLRLARKWEILRFMPQEYLDQELQSLIPALAYEADRQLARSILIAPRTSRQDYVNFQIAHGRGRMSKRLQLMGCAILGSTAFAMYNWLM